jgi:hypothetical protein
LVLSEVVVKCITSAATVATKEGDTDAACVVTLDVGTDPLKWATSGHCAVSVDEVVVTTVGPLSVFYVPAADFFGLLLGGLGRPPVGTGGCAVDDDFIEWSHGPTILSTASLIALIFSSMRPIVTAWD